MRLLTSIVVGLLSFLQPICAEEIPIYRVHTMSVIVSKAELAKMMQQPGADSYSYYDSVRSLMAAGKAQVHDVNIITLREGRRGTVESVREEIYPTEIEASDGLPVRKEVTVLPSHTLGGWFRAFETRNAGVTLTTEVSRQETTGGLRLTVAYEYVKRIKMDVELTTVLPQTILKIQQPRYQTIRQDMVLPVQLNQFTLTNTFAVKGADGKLDSRKKMLFFAMVQRVN